MGPFGSRIRKENYRPFGVPVIRGINLDAEQFLDDGFVYLSEEKAAELESSHAFPHDIIFVAQGTIGRVGIIPKSPRYERYVLSQNLMKLTCDKSKADPVFVFYYFRSPYGQHEILSHANPTGVPCISRPLTSLRSFRVPLPPLVGQRAMAQMLAALDRKIDLNRKMNQTLESIARAIFKSWFVDFQPVHAKARGEQPYGMDAETAALFPDSFTDSHLGPIPAGCRVGTVGEIAHNPRRSARPDDIDPDTPYIGLQHMPQNSITLDRWGQAQQVTSSKYAFADGDILFGKLRPYFHKVGLAPVDGVCSTDILVVAPKRQEWHSLVLSNISSVHFVDYTTAVSTGTKMPRTNWRDMSRYEIVIPSQAVAAAFHKQIHPLVEAIRNNILQSRTLAELRDTLLPKLISGQLRVPAADQFKENAP